jgi:hypothetical protein
MEKEAVNNKEIADVLVSLCFTINALKKMSVDGQGPLPLLLEWTHRDIVQMTDALLGAFGIKGMVREAGRTKDFIKNTLTIYGMFPEESAQKTKIVDLLELILDGVTELEDLLVHQLDRNL